jgi:hypothetical protein
MAVIDRRFTVQRHQKIPGKLILSSVERHRSPDLIQVQISEEWRLGRHVSRSVVGWLLE